MPDAPAPTIEQLERDGYTHIEGQCRYSLKQVPFAYLRRKGWEINGMTIAELAAKMRCADCGWPPTKTKAWRQEDASGYSKGW